MDFRAAWFSREYEAAIAFYGEGLGLPVAASWDHGPEDRGTIFELHGGRIEVMGKPPAPRSDGPWDYRPPQGVTLVIEVPDVEASFRQAEAGGLAIRAGLTDQTWGHRSFMLDDPDGQVVYVYAPSIETEA